MPSLVDLSQTSWVDGDPPPEDKDPNLAAVRGLLDKIPDSTSETPGILGLVKDTASSLSDSGQPEKGLSMVGMIKSAVGSIINLMEAGHGDRPADPIDALALSGPEGVAARFYPVNALGIFGSNFMGKASSPLYAKLNAGLDKAHEFIDSHPNLTEAEKDAAMQKFAGMSKDYHGNWQFELDDSKAKLNPDLMNVLFGVSTPLTTDLSVKIANNQVKLPDILDHPDLFEAFPQLKNVKIKPIDDPDIAGYYHHTANTMAVDFSQPPEDVLGTIMHETQHAVQASDADAGTRKSLGEAYNVEHLTKSMSQLYDIYDRAVKKNLIDESQKVAFNDMLKTLSSAAAAYSANPGEVEARNVMARLGLSEPQRKAIPPTYTEDIARKYQLDLEDFRTLHMKAQQRGMFLGGEE